MTQGDQKLVNLLLIEVKLLDQLIFDPDFDHYLDTGTVQYWVIILALSHVVVEVAKLCPTQWLGQGVPPHLPCFNIMSTDS